jgi:hypothetical protein
MSAHAVVIATLLFASVSAYDLQAPAAQTATADKWAPLRFLLGTWETTSTGQAGNGTGRREYRLVLHDQFIEARSIVTYPPQEKNPKGEVHEDLGYFSFDKSRKAFVFRQFHVEGFVTTYATEPSSTSASVFNSENLENLPAGWRARETYRVLDKDSVVELFELAGPGKDFAVYSETRLRRVK